MPRSTMAGTVLLPILALAGCHAGEGTETGGAEEPGVAADGPPPSWAYPVNPPDASRPPDDGVPRSVPGSDLTLTLSEIRDPFDPPDWHSDDHPPMPEIVARGRRPDVIACGYCHLPNGQGRPENAAVAGLPAEYIVRQTADFRMGDRRSSEPEMGPPGAMVRVAEAATEEEVRSAARYFASLDFRSRIRVVEADSVPETRVSGWKHVPVEGGGSEPLGRRIVEVPEDPERTRLRDPRSGFVAYVPPGSVARGEELAAGRSDRTVSCAPCHGDDLGGVGPVPGIAGRSPSYLVRQLYDLQAGSRRGPWAPLMDEAVERLAVDDMIALAAYAASLDP